MADDGGGAVRYLSDLPDDLLRHILFFAPAREGATTAVLSQRWRWLWRTSGAVNLDSCSFIIGCSSPEEERDAFLRGGEEALAAGGGGPIRRLTFTIAKDSKIYLMLYYSSGEEDESSEEPEHNLVEAMVSDPAARQVEELQIDVRKRSERYRLSVGSLPSEALRVLRLTNCSALTAPEPPPDAAATFPMLVDLHLDRCSVCLVDFQAVVDVAPRLSTLHLESSTLSGKQDVQQPVIMGRQLRLLLPAVTALVLADCEIRCGYGEERGSLELDVPRLRYLRYKGSIQQTKPLSLKLPPPQTTTVSSNMVQVDLELSYDRHHCYNYSSTPSNPSSNLFWRFIQNFSTAKILKIILDDTLTMDDVALVEKTSRDELLGGLSSFRLLEKLQLDANYNYKPEHRFETSSMVMLADFLHRCPVVRDLKLRFGKHYEIPGGWIESSIDKEAGLHFDKSVNGFRNRRTQSSMDSLLGDGQNNDVNYEAIGIPAGLTGEHSFSFLQSHLQRVSLHFSMDEPNCLELQLAKFFAENAMVLREMHIDDGSQEMMGHVNSSLGRWIANIRNGNITNCM